MSDPAEKPQWRYDDLMYRSETGPMTPERAFTIAELMAYRLRDASGSVAIREALSELAGSIAMVSKSWRS